VTGETGGRAIHTKPVPIVIVKGSHREMGRQIGEEFREQVQLHVQNTHALIDATYESLELTWDSAQIQARKYVPYAQERYPQYVEEMEGIAEGAGIQFGDVAVVNTLEGVAMDALHLSKCTSMAVNEDCTADGRVLLAHNEDWLPEDEDAVYMVHATPDDEPPFLAMTYGALLPNIGLNAAGIAQCCDAVHPNDRRIGIPRVIVSRAVFAARTPGDALRSVLVPRRAAGYNHLLATDTGELFNVEVSARRFAVLYGEQGCLVHTNHYLDPEMQAIESDADELIGTRIRYHRARRLLLKSRQHTVKTLQAIQRDHVNFPNSICNHVDTSMKILDREQTINAMVLDLTSRAVHIAWGNPCVNAYHTYYLDA